jgi:hypothetical protein
MIFACTLRKKLAPLATAAVAVLLSLALMSAPLRAQESPSPLLWKVEQGNSTLYLFGTFHLLSKDVRWLDQRIAGAVDSAGELVLEISEEQTDTDLVVSIVREKGMYRRAGGLREALSSDTWLELARQAEAVGIPGQAIAQFRPWYAAIVLSITYAQAQGFLPEYGAETILTARAKAAGIPVLGLETAQEQLSTLADHPERVQVMMLEDTLQELENLPQILGDMTRAWVSGDEDAIAELIVGGMRQIPELYEAVIVQRNRNWIPLLEARLDKPGIYFVAVGIGHLVGEDSVVAMLRDRSHSVQPVK